MRRGGWGSAYIVDDYIVDDDGASWSYHAARVSVRESARTGCATIW